MKPLRKTKPISTVNKRHRPYRVVFIDWNGTLSASKFWGHLEKSAPKVFASIENTLFGNLRNLIKPWMKGEIDSEYVIRMISDRSGLSYTKVFDEFIYSCINMKYVSSKVPTLINKLKKTGSKVVIATDNMDSFTRWTTRYMNTHSLFNDVLNSHDLRGMKKDTNNRGKSIFFSNYFKKHDIKPGESILIDDSNDDIETIESFGINYIHTKPAKGLLPALRKLISHN